MASRIPQPATALVPIAPAAPGQTAQNTPRHGDARHRARSPAAPAAAATRAARRAHGRTASPPAPGRGRAARVPPPWPPPPERPPRQARPPAPPRTPGSPPAPPRPAHPAACGSRPFARIRGCRTRRAPRQKRCSDQRARSSGPVMPRFADCRGQRHRLALSPPHDRPHRPARAAPTSPPARLTFRSRARCAPPDPTRPPPALTCPQGFGTPRASVKGPDR